MALLVASNQAAAVPVYWSVNGHWYDVVVFPNHTWAEARADAQAKGPAWDLATITSAAEQAFIASLLPSLPLVPAPGTGVSEYWVGGYQPPGSPEPAGNWQWVSGEAFSYTNWGGVEPNNSGGENHLALDNRSGWGWNDNDPFINGYVTGYVAEAVPEPGTMLLLGGGLLGLARLRRRGR